MIPYRNTVYSRKGQTTFMLGKLNQAPPTNEKSALIGVDWGTSSCRAYLMDSQGRILNSTTTDQGILHVKGGAFAETLEAMIGTWRRPGLPIILSGMIGSRQGWIEVPYLSVPTSFDAIANALVRHIDDPDIYITPGLAQNLPDEAPDVIRGEETQIIGAIGATSDRQLLIMPGTHSKWALAETEQIIRFATFMTGELFAVMKDHSILGRLMVKNGVPHNNTAFKRGLDAVATLPGGLLQHLFSARTLSLFDQLPAESIADYLSGLLIGHELKEAFQTFNMSSDLPPITVIGASALAQRYVAALEHVGLVAETAGDHMAACGQSRLARAAKILPF
ncbi:MAG: 2-dehydro-3-deoxygalactonokinase [Pseudomonadota bacterium]